MPSHELPPRKALRRRNLPECSDGLLDQAAAFLVLRFLGFASASLSSAAAAFLALAFLGSAFGALAAFLSSFFSVATAAESTNCISAMSALSPGRGSIFRIRV